MQSCYPLFVWTEVCQRAFFEVLKLLSAVKPEVDATVSGAGAVLLQAGKSGVSYPLCYLLSLNATSSTTRQ